MGNENEKQKKEEEKLPEEKTSIFSCGPGRNSEDGSKAKKAQGKELFVITT
jgi:hypothetical protein